MTQDETSTPPENASFSSPHNGWTHRFGHYLLPGILGIAVISSVSFVGSMILSHSEWYQNIDASSFDYSSQSSYQTTLKKRIEDSKKTVTLEFERKRNLEGLITTDQSSLRPDSSPSSPLDSVDFKNSKLKGSNFYLEKPSSDFVHRVSNWLDYLGIAALLPDPSKVSATQISNNLQKIGNNRLYGLASNKSTSLLFRPGDYSTFIHEMKHLVREDEFNALGGEAGSYALQVFAGGDYKLAVDSLDMLYADSKTEGILTRWLTEALFVAGDETFSWLKEYNHAKVQYGDKIVDLVGLVEHLQKRVGQFEKEVIRSGITPEQYLVEFHKVSPLVARKIMEATGEDSLDGILRGTNETKKKMISAFKSLTSFYYVNLGYTLQEAAAKAEQHFEREDALTIASTLYSGAKEVFARFEEHNVPFEMQKQIVEMLISNGPDFARLYAETFPRLLDFTANFGKRGWVIMERFFSDEDFHHFLLQSKGLDSLERLYKDDPSISSRVLDELLQYRFDYEKDNVLLDMDGFAYPTNNGRFTSPQKAEIIATTLVLSSVPYGSPALEKKESWDKNSRDGELVSCREFHGYKVAPFVTNYSDGQQCIATLKKLLVRKGRINP